MKITVIGLGLSYEDLTKKHLSSIFDADVLVGGARHLNYFPDFSGQKIEITKDLKSVVHQIETCRQALKKVVVLASGDPLYYGIGSYLIKKIGTDQVIILPNISSVAGAFAKINQSWQDAKVVSLHGRPLEREHILLFRCHPKIAVLTDAQNTPFKLSGILDEYEISDFHMCVLENLGNEKETINWFEPGQSIPHAFDSPNLVILLRKGLEEKKYVRNIFPGMPDERYCHERGLITKPEVRVVALSKLRLQNDSILWDLGSGSGSVSIEASFFINKGHIFAVEKDKNRIQDIKKNKHTFNVPNLTVVHGRLPEKMDDLPDPDRIFIGGGGKDLVRIIEQSASRLSKAGIIVINSVLFGNTAKCLETFGSLGFETDIVQVAVSFGHKMPWDLMFKSQNPVFIVSARKP